MSFNYKYGKTAATYDARDLRFNEYRTAVTLPTHPNTFTHASLVPAADWGMLGNDEYGDCVWAGSDHEVILLNKEAGATVEFTAENALSDYSAVTGFNPDNPDTDQGTNVHDALNYRVNTGTIDATGKRHKIGAFASLEPGDLNSILEASYLFGVVGIGIQVPESAQTQFQNGKPWSYVPGAAIEGGHYVPIVGYPRAGYLQVVTWGKVQLMTKGFFEHYCDEAYAILDSEFLKDGKSLEGFDLAQLQADLQAI